MYQAPPPSVLAQILVGLRFPADSWQVLAHVDHYGPDPGTRHLFWQLPEQRYLTVGAVLAALGQVPDGARHAPGAMNG